MKIFLRFLSTIILLSIIVVLYNSEGQTPRKVILEEATNASCGPCAAQNPILKPWIDGNTDRVIPVVYHASWPGNNDPIYQYNKAMNDNRIVTYYKINSVPSGRINGLFGDSIKGPYKGAPGDTTGLSSKLNSFPATSPISIKINFTNYGSTGKVDIEVISTQALSTKKLRVVIVEQVHHYDNAGSNGEKDFEHLARVMLPDHNGTSISLIANVPKQFSFNYTLNPDVNFNLTAVAFIQDDKTNEILQAESDFETPLFALSSVTPDKFSTVSNSQPFGKGFNILNNTSTDVVFSVSVEKSVRTPSDWTAQSDKTGDITVKSNSTENINFSIIPGSSIGIGDAQLILQAKDNPNLILKSGMITALSNNVQTLQVIDDDTKYSLSSYIDYRKTPSDYIEISADNYVAVSNNLTSLKTLVWNTGTVGGLTTAKSTALTDAISNGANVMAVGNNIASNLNYYNALPFFNVEYIGYNIEGFGSSPWRVWLSGITGDVITNFLGSNKEGNLISYLLPVLKIIDTSSTFPILRFNNSGRYVNAKKDTVSMTAEESIFAVRSLIGDQRLILMSFCPYVLKNAQLRGTLVWNCIQWLETGIVSVEENTSSNENSNLSISSSPNPVEISSNIVYNIKGDKIRNIRLSLYNLLGEEVIILKTGMIQPGEYSAQLNAQELISGRYELILRADSDYITLPVYISK
jgi:hypothetical protein